MAWQAYQTWDREAELREAKSVAGLLLKQEMKEESMCQRKEKQKRRARFYLLHILAPCLQPVLLKGHHPHAMWISPLQPYNSRRMPKGRGKGHHCTLTCPHSLSPNKTQTNLTSPKKSFSPIAASFDGCRAKGKKGVCIRCL